MNLLIDSGSQWNLLKLNNVPNHSKINNSCITDLRGIADHTISTVGVVQMMLFNKPIPFLVITDDLNTPFDGIIGSSFLNEHKAIIDFNLEKLVINHEMQEMAGRNFYKLESRIINIHLNQQTNDLKYIHEQTNDLKYIHEQTINGQLLIDSGAERSILQAILK